MDHRFYAIQTTAGHENKVRSLIQRKIEADPRPAEERLIRQALVPTQDVVEIKNGKKVNVERKIFPGYVLVEMEMTDDSWHLVKSTPKVTGFVGGTANKPTPISQKEVDAILQQVQEGVERPKPSISFEIGENVRVSDGPFASFNGSVQEVDEERSRLKVEVSIFGRAVPVDLEFGQVEKT